MCPVCVSVLLSHTVLLELYQEKLMTEDEVKRMKEERRDLSEGLVYLQCTKPSEMVARTVKLLDKNQHKASARQLRGLWGSHNYSTVKSV